MKEQKYYKSPITINPQPTDIKTWILENVHSSLKNKEDKEKCVKLLSTYIKEKITSGQEISSEEEKDLKEY